MVRFKSHSQLHYRRQRCPLKTLIVIWVISVVLCLIVFQFYISRKYHNTTIQSTQQAQQVDTLGKNTLQNLRWQSKPRQIAMQRLDKRIEDTVAGQCWCNCTQGVYSLNDAGKMRIGATAIDDTSSVGNMERKMGMDQIYVLNLDWREHRRLYMDALMGYIGIEGIVWPAVTMQDSFVQEYWPSFNASVAELRKKKNAPLIMTSPGEVACWQSHLSIWRDIKENNYEMALILEDDVDLVIDLPQRVQEILNTVPESWDIIWLGACAEDIKKKKHLGANVYEANHPYCTHAYMLHGAGTANKLIEALGTHIKAPIDEEIRLYMNRRRRREKDFFGYSVIPTISEQLPRDQEHNPSDVRFTTEEIPRKPVENSARVGLVQAIKTQQQQKCDIPIMMFGLNTTSF